MLHLHLPSTYPESVEIVTLLGQLFCDALTLSHSHIVYNTVSHCFVLSMMAGDVDSVWYGACDSAGRLWETKVSSFSA